MLKKEDAVLVVVDVQGKLASLMHGKDEFFLNVRRMIQGAKVLGLPVLWNEQTPEKLGGTVPEVRGELGGLKPFVKETFSCCGCAAFMRALKDTGRRQVLLCGMETHICVYLTAADLLGAGYEVHLAADAVSSRTQRNRDLGTQRMKDDGAHLTTVEMSLFEIMKAARGQEFKKLIQIIK